MMDLQRMLRACAIGFILTLLLAGPVTAQGAGQRVEVWKSPTCGCCGKWVEHLRAAGFDVQVKDSARMSTVKSQLGVPDDLQACHTAKVGGYVVEGHVPAADIVELLAKKPDVSGISVPGMPMGSPGMEVPSGEKEPFETLTFDRSGKTKVFAKHAGAPAK